MGEELFSMRAVFVVCVAVLVLNSARAQYCGLNKDVSCTDIVTHMNENTSRGDVDLFCEHNTYWCWWCFLLTDPDHSKKNQYLEYCRSYDDHKFPGSDEWLDWYGKGKVSTDYRK